MEPVIKLAAGGRRKKNSLLRTFTTTKKHGIVEQTFPIGVSSVANPDHQIVF